MRLRRKDKTALIYLALLAAMFAVAFVWYSYQKYHPMITGEVKVEHGVLFINSPTDVVIVVNGRIIGPTRHYEVRLNDLALVELWFGNDNVYRYLIYRGADGQYRIIWHYKSS